MKWFFFPLLIIHALIHLLGFFKAFQLAEINQLTQNISKPIGMLWLIALLLFLATAIQFISNHDLWWVTAIAAVILSQVLIIMFWQDAKFGTVMNVVIVLVSVATFADWNFNREVENEITDMFSKNSIAERKVLEESMIKDLPYPVQKWLTCSGAIGKEMIQSVRLKQKGEMRMKPEQDNWYAAYAEQYFTVHQPAFIWKTKVDIMPMVFFTGRDYFTDGKGKMLLKLFHLLIS